MVLEVYNELAAKLGMSADVVVILLLVMVTWKLIWYGIALYKTIKENNKKWFVIFFVAAFVLNDVGILPIVYLLMDKYKGKWGKKGK